MLLKLIMKVLLIVNVVGVDHGGRLGVSLATLIFISCSACYLLFCVFSQQRQLLYDLEVVSHATVQKFDTFLVTHRYIMSMATAFIFKFLLITSTYFWLYMLMNMLFPIKSKREVNLTSLLSEEFDMKASLSYQNDPRNIEIYH